MAKAASASSPEVKLSKFDLDALFSRQKANFATLHEVQNVLVETAQAIARVQYSWFEKSLASTRAVLSRKEPRTLEVALATTRIVSEKSFAVTRQSMELAVAAQRRVSELLAQSGQSNASGLKVLAA